MSHSKIIMQYITLAVALPMVPFLVLEHCKKVQRVSRSGFGETAAYSCKAKPILYDYSQMSIGNLDHGVSNCFFFASGSPLPIVAW